MWFLFYAGRRGMRSRGRNRRAGRTTWTGGWAAIWLIAIGTTGIYLIAKHPAAGLAILAGLVVLTLMGVAAGHANREAKAEKAAKAAASQKAQRDALDSLMARYEAEDEARKAQRRAAFAALNEHAQKGERK